MWARVHYIHKNTNLYLKYTARMLNVGMIWLCSLPYTPVSYVMLSALRH